MALQPETNEAFLREVDEELRRDQALRFWQRYGRALIALVVVGLVALAAFLWWRHHREQVAGEQGEVLAGAISSLEAGNTTAAVPPLNTVKADGGEAARAAAALALAAVQVQKNDGAGAARQFAAIAADTNLPQAYRDLALVRQTAAEYDALPPAKVIDRLRGLATPGSPWFGSAGEMLGIAFLRNRQPQQAAALFAQIGKDNQVPESIRSRVVQLNAGIAAAGTAATPAAK